MEGLAPGADIFVVYGSARNVIMFEKLSEPIELKLNGASIENLLAVKKKNTITKTFCFVLSDSFDTP